MDFATITMEKKDQIGTITLNRPDKMNTFSSQLARELNDALRHMDADDQMRVVIVAPARPFPRASTSPSLPGKPPRNTRPGAR
jgi:enoyl-CoA hydratase/carnithine racemase